MARLSMIHPSTVESNRFLSFHRTVPASNGLQKGFWNEQQEVIELND